MKLDQKLDEAAKAMARFYANATSNDSAPMTDQAWRLLWEVGYTEAVRERYRRMAEIAYGALVGELEVNVTTFELLAAACGNAHMVSTSNGLEVQLRLATPEELIEKQKAAMELFPEGLSGPPVVTLEQAAELVKPLEMG